VLTDQFSLTKNFGNLNTIPS